MVVAFTDTRSTLTPRYQIGDLGSLKGNGDIGIGYRPAMAADKLHDAAQQDFAVYALEFVGAVGEKVPYVAEGEGSEQGVAQGMNSHIAVGMGHEANSRRHLYSAEPHRQPHPKLMYVVSLSYSKHCIQYYLSAAAIADLLLVITLSSVRGKRLEAAAPNLPPPLTGSIITLSRRSRGKP